ncbi:hypothetical protein ATZ36_15875 [Candidatus Endomicrobiellum trichonymphae]|uniref:Uncharacterized protein n=1 Tax=Endomicrobium trichonymphae TaxID=1408204 RepID=A0A1E5ILB4_ENDTX|nr:hypothetical protein ATZ36_15875 [Candidatus Endomicrobium trichonymphae]
MIKCPRVKHKNNDNNLSVLLQTKCKTLRLYCLANVERFRIMMLLNLLNANDFTLYGKDNRKLRQAA